MNSLGLARPFVYLSEAVLTTNHPITLVHDLARKTEGIVNSDLISYVWKQKTLSVRSQANLYQARSQYKPERYNQWIGNLADSIAESIRFPSSEKRRAFRKLLQSELVRVNRYELQPGVRKFLEELGRARGLWGVIANESHLYQAILTYVGVKPFALVPARPGLFKPMPLILQKAFERVPRDYRYNVWFVGSKQAPCDNIQHPNIHTALLGDMSDLDTMRPSAAMEQRRLHIKDLQELLPVLGFGCVEKFDFGELSPLSSITPEEKLAKAAQSLGPPKAANQVLPRGKRELSLSDLASDNDDLADKVQFPDLRKSGGLDRGDE